MNQKKPYNYKIIIAYEGAEYSGWQIQPNTMSIQEKIQTTLEIFLRESIHIIGSGRTDAGVHAIGQAANFHTTKPLDLRRFLLAANGILPEDIRILSIEQVSDDFHARYHAIRKEYHYHVHTSLVQDPFTRKTSLHFRYPVDTHAIRKATQYFVGTHDFRSFANSRGKGHEELNTVRTIERLDLIEEPGKLRFEFVGNGFLYKMVRNITGFLLHVASGKRKPEEALEILAAKSRPDAPMAAPAKGLFLMKVDYPEETKT